MTDSLLAPLRHLWFRWLWAALWLAYVGGWVQVVAAQWALVSLPDAGAAVTLVPTAVLLPIALLTLPARALADAVDRRRLMFVVSAYVFALAGVLGIVSALGRATPGVLVIFTFGLGVGGALLLPTWTSVLEELVPTDEVRAATRLQRHSVALAPIVGPLLAGAVIVGSGVWNAFALTAFSVVFLGALALLRPPRSVPRRGLEVAALRPTLGRLAQPIAHDAVLRQRLLRTVLFLAPAAAWWALLPLAARDQLGLDAVGYGALLAAFGGGSIAGAALTARWGDRVPTRLVRAGAGAVFAAALVLIGWLPTTPSAVPVCLLAGAAWGTIITVLEGPTTTQLITAAGSMAIASLLWGQLAELIGVSWTFLVAAVAVLAGAVVGAVGSEPDARE